MTFGVHIILQDQIILRVISFMRELEVARLESAFEHKGFVIVILRGVVVVSWETHRLTEFSNHRLLAVTMHLI